MRRRDLTSRKDLAGLQAERWRPPLFVAPSTWRARTFALLRRTVDLPAASIWRDLAPELASASGVVVDVGCGAQPYRGLVSDQATYIGIDRVGAEAEFGYDLPDAIYYEGDRWPLADESADLVLCTEVLEHVLEPLGLLQEAHRCLKGDGRLLVTVPFAARWHFIPYDYWRFTPSSITHLFEQADFKRVQVYARGNALTVACYKLIALILPLLMPQSRRVTSQARRLIAIPLVPFVVVAALVGRLTLLGRNGGDDCLGYTAVGWK